MNWEDEVSKILIISLLCVWQVQEWILSMKNGLKFLKKVESKRSQSEIIFKSLACFSVQFRVTMKVLNLYLLNKLRSFGDKSSNGLATETTLNFWGPCRREGPANLINHSVRTNLEIKSIIDSSYKSILICLYNNEKNLKDYLSKMLPISAPPHPQPLNPPPGTELWGAESLQTPTLTGPLARGNYNALLLQFLYIWAKKTHLLPWGNISSTLTRRSLILVPSLFESSAVVNLHFSCPNVASVLSLCYSWYLLTWNCLQLQFSDNDRFNPRFASFFRGGGPQFTTANYFLTLFTLPWKHTWNKCWILPFIFHPSHPKHKHSWKAKVNLLP